MLVLVDSFSIEDPVEDFNETNPFWVTASNQLMELLIVFEDFVEATEYAAAEHHDALFQGSSDELFFVLRLAAATSLLIVEVLALTNKVLNVHNFRRAWSSNHCGRLLQTLRGFI